MQKFQELLTEAAQLKEAQLKNQRKNYESLPDYLKSGLNYSRKYLLLRKQDYMIQMTLSERLKKQGNQLFKIQHFPEALNKYEESLGIFRYIHTKSYDNMKDEDLVYETYVLPESMQEYSEEYTTHLIALYLNICSCLTKTNKKEDAIHSADQALKLKQTAKGYYKKAQAYLQYINKETQDIKLGFYYLNKSYQLSKDPSIVQQMHKIKKEIDEDREKEKKWFKFMFDKNSQPNKQMTQNEKQVKNVAKGEEKGKNLAIKNDQLKNLQKQKGDDLQRQDVRLQKTKQKLSRFTDSQLSDSEWLQLYQGQFIARHGSKIYSIIQLYGYKEYLGEYKALLAQCLEFRKEQSQKRKELYAKYFQWLKQHPIDKIAKYTERYELQTKWIAQQRLNPQTQQNSQKTLKNQQKEQQKGEFLDRFGNVEARQETKIQIKKQQTKNKQIEIQVIPQQIKEAVQNFPISQQSKQAQTQPTLLPQSQQQQQPQIPKKQSNIKLYSFIIALFIILVLKFFL